MAAIIEVKDLKVTINGFPVLKGTDFSVLSGEIVVIAGASGSGKTVLLKTILGLIPHQAGKVIINGRDTTSFSPDDWKEARRTIGMVFQNNALFDSLTVWENVGFYLLEHSRLPAEAVRAEAGRILSLVGLSETEDLYPEELSGGMKKRVALARTIISSPQIIYYDEPTSGLDPATATSIESLILNIHRHLKATGLIVTHDRECAFRLADKIGLLDDGKIIGWDLARTVAEKRSGPVAEFFQLKAPLIKVDSK